MKPLILVTGGAGFIGSHIVDELVTRGYRVRVLDSLEPQVHGTTQKWPSYRNPGAQYVRGDVRNASAVARALHGVSVVYHEAAGVGVGQSMYEIERYVSLNSLGAAVLLDAVLNRRAEIQKLIVASSMSIYGEGKYRCPRCGVIHPQLRTASQLKRKRWEMTCPTCGRGANPLPTDESKPLYPTSVYAVTKRDHEELFLCVGRAYKIPTVALRYFNVYGTRQSLSNPYTGVAAIFSSRMLNQNPPVIFEDGLQSRDFVHVSDVVQANLLAFENPKADYHVFNVGTGHATSVLQVAKTLARLLQFEKQPLVQYQFREGDIRHCFADISRISTLLRFRPRVTFEHGMQELVAWLQTQTASDRLDKALGELKRRGLA